MIISHKNRFIFLRVPKTASTSVEVELAALCGPQDIVTELTSKNDSSERLKQYSGPLNHQRTLWQYQLSDWYRLIAKGKRPSDLRHATALQAKKLVGNKVWDAYYKFCFVRNPFDRAVSLYYWETKNWERKRHSIPPDVNTYILGLPEQKLSTWFRLTIKGSVALDYIGKFESLEMDTTKISQQLELPALNLSHSKGNIRKDRQHYSQILNQETRAHIEKLCAPELDAFGYSWAAPEKQ